MNANGVRRALRRMGEDVILRRFTGTQRIPSDLKMRALVNVGGAIVLVGGVQQTADKFTITSDEMDRVNWRGSVQHGDIIIYSDGRTTAVQGRGNDTQMGRDRVITFNCIGGT